MSDGINQSLNQGTPGERLRAGREVRGVDLAAAHEGTKIPLPLLEALERDEYHKLSGPLYVRSFLRNYGEWLGLDVDGLLRAYESLSGGTMGAAGDDMIWSEDVVEVRRVGGAWRRDTMLVGAGVVGVVIIALVIWWLVARGGDDAQPVATPPVSSDVQPENTEVAVVEPVAGAEAQQPEIRQPEPMVEAPVEQAAAPAPARSLIQPADRDESAEDRLARLDSDSLTVGLHPVIAEAAPILPAAIPADATVPFAAGTANELVLRVQLPAPTNCSVRCDGQRGAKPVIWPARPQPLPSGDIEPGRAYAVADGFAVYWGAADNFTLTLGDLQGASASLNQRDLPVQQWKPGQPVVLDQHTLDRIGG